MELFDYVCKCLTEDVPKYAEKAFNMVSPVQVSVTETKEPKPKKDRKFTITDEELQHKTEEVKRSSQTSLININVNLKM